MKNRRSSGVFVLLILVILLGAASVFVWINDKNETRESESIEYPVVVFKEDIRFEIDPRFEDNDVSSLKDILNLDKSEIDEVILLKYSIKKPGEYRGELKVRRSDVVQVKQFTYTVYDDIAPVISQEKIFRTEVGKKIDFLDFLTVSDNSLQEGETIVPKIEGTVKWDTAGEYRIRISAKDLAGNETFYEAIVYIERRNVVVPQPPTTSDTDSTDGAGSGSEDNNDTDTDQHPDPSEDEDTNEDEDIGDV